jgi:P-type Ca2+ transporter type 2C
MPKTSIAWYSFNSTQALKKLNTSKKGLTSHEAVKRLEKYGPNKLAQSRKFSGWRLFIFQFKSAMVYILLVAGVISMLFGEFVDAYVILAAVLINVVVGFFQEYKANKSLEKLNQVVKNETLVLRDGHETKIESKDLVPGDIIILEAGFRIPADARLLQVNSLEINEANLTGESVPVKKHIRTIDSKTVLAERKNMVFMGTLVVEGRASAVVCKTGLETEVGQITVMLKETKDEQTPLQIKLNDFAKFVTKAVLIIAFLMFLLGVIEGHQWAEMFTIAVAVAVSAIPEGLVIGMTMILTVGMQRILKNNGLVRKLISAETLGSTTIICTDKTGTLTEGEMRVTQIATNSNNIDLAVKSLKDIDDDKEINMLMQSALLCNDAVVENPDNFVDYWSVIGSPTEKALLLFGAQSSEIRDLIAKYTRVEEIPFDSDKKYMVTRHHFDAKRDIIFIKGAPEKILEFSKTYLNKNKATKLNKSKQDYFQNQWESLSKKGLRVLAGSYKLVPKTFKGLESCKDQPHDMIMIGIWGLSDPLRPETKETIQETRQAGIRTVIITGDNKFTASRIATDLGINTDKDSVVTGDELLKMSDEQLNKKIRNIKVYARVTPGDKLRIIKAWQQLGEIVSMTGDGVNDAPALKAADVGVVVSSGSDVAKETADLVLLDNNFKTIVMAIKQGRVIFANIKKVILYLLSDSFSEVMIIVGSLIMRIPLPILTVQILWVNLVNDSLPALSLTMEPEDEAIMNKKPRPHKKLLDFENKFLIFTISIITGATSLWLFWYFWKSTGDLDLARTVVFTALAIDSLLYVFSIKSLDHNIFKAKPFRNMYLNISVIIGFLLQLMAIYLPFLNKYLKTVPLSWREWQMILIMVAVAIVCIEIVKAIFIWKFKHKKS